MKKALARNPRPFQKQCCVYEFFNVWNTQTNPASKIKAVKWVKKRIRRPDKRIIRAVSFTLNNEVL